MFLMPFLVLIPDLILKLTKKVFYPTPTDALMRYYEVNKGSYNLDEVDRVRVTPENSAGSQQNVSLFNFQIKNLCPRCMATNTR